MYKALSSEEPLERRKASACFSRVARAVSSVQANEKEREADSDKIKSAVQPLLGFQPEAGGGSVDLSKGNAEVLLVVLQLYSTNLMRVPCTAVCAVSVWYELT